MNPVATQTFRLSYGDCDQAGVAYFAIFYPWMERTYSCWMYDHGIAVDSMVERFGVATVGVRSEATYLRPVFVFDVLCCEMFCERIGNSSYTLAFEFRRDDEPVTLGSITFACRANDGAKAEVPERFAEALDSLRAKA